MALIWNVLILTLGLIWKALVLMCRLLILILAANAKNQRFRKPESRKPKKVKVFVPKFSPPRRYKNPSEKEIFRDLLAMRRKVTSKKKK
jgi:hypothetical protein